MKNNRMLLKFEYWTHPGIVVMDFASRSILKGLFMSLFFLSYMISTFAIGNVSQEYYFKNLTTFEETFIQQILKEFQSGYVSEEEVDCGFIITKAIRLPGGGYYICVQANDQVTAQQWEVIQSGIVVDTGTSPNICWTIDDGAPYFTIKHYMMGLAGYYLCDTEIFHILSDSLCKENVISSTNENCDLTATISIQLDSLPTGVTEYVVTYGDGSLAEVSSSSVLTHTYSTPGTYTVCLTYDLGEDYLTCCYDIDVLMPPGCICPEDFVSVTNVDPCTWETTLCFDLDSTYFPLCVLFGDGEDSIITEPCIVYDYETSGGYTVCFKYSPFPGDTIVCCEGIAVPVCCLDAYFELDQLISSPSCLNPMFRVNDQACLDTLSSSHTWIFSDSTYYYGATPPDHMFTNFVDSFGEVCVTHIIECCGVFDTFSVCVEHIAGAYLGYPGDTLKFSDVLPFTNETVAEFIATYANGTLNLTIDGILVGDIDGNFGAGTWNMGMNAEILILGTPGTSNYRKLALYTTVIQSAVRIERTACCRWRGIISSGSTAMTWTDARITDAEVMLHYPEETVPSIWPPWVKISGCSFLNHFFAIKSVEQYVVFIKFEDNELVGAPHSPQYCGCDAINAIDFRGVNALRKVKFKVDGDVNTITNFEQGFHFNNANLNVQNFAVDSLRDYQPIQNQPNNPVGDGAIGIDFRWGTTGNSSLALDNMEFANFIDQDATSNAIRDFIYFGKHSLSANASNPLTSITTENISGGYNLGISNFAMLNGSITGNELSTNGGVYGFGVHGLIQSYNNLFFIGDNYLDISTGASSQLNGGVTLTQSYEGPQQYQIIHNDIDVNMGVGSGIGIFHAGQSLIRRNTIIGGSNDIPGINLTWGGQSRIECNDVRNKSRGIFVLGSEENQYSDNNLRANEIDIRFALNSMGATGSLIRWNTFRNSDEESLRYVGFVGAQFHNQYNDWIAQFEEEVVHSTSIPLAFNVIEFPLGQGVSGINHPMSSPTDLFVEAGDASLDTIPPTGFCTTTFDGLKPEYPDSLFDPIETWEAILGDTAYWATLTEAEEVQMQQEIYGLLLDNTSWIGTSAIFSDYFDTMDTTFVGQSENFKQDMQFLISELSDHQMGMTEIRNDVDSLSELIEIWTDATFASTNSSERDSLQALVGSTLPIGDSLMNVIHLLDSTFRASILDSISVLVSRNDNLDDTEWYTWFEKRYNEIVLDMMAGTEPDSAALADLRTMAQSCFADGGRSVWSARGLCEVLLKEYYDEDTCDPITEERSTEFGYPVQSPVMRISPNPASNVIRVELLDGLVSNDGYFISILTISGQAVYNGVIPNGESETMIPLSTLHNGMYVVHVRNGKEEFTQPLLIQR